MLTYIINLILGHRGWVLQNEQSKDECTNWILETKSQPFKSFVFMLYESI